MSVLVEALTVVIRRNRLTAIHPRAVDQFFKNAPNTTARADSHLVAVGFMNPDDVRVYVRTLEQEAGFRHLEDGECIDIAVVSQIGGLTAPCKWLAVGTDARGVVHEIALFAMLKLKRSGRALDSNLLNFVVNHSLANNLYFIRFVCGFLDRWAVHETLQWELQRALSVRAWADILEVVASRAQQAGSTTKDEIRRVLGHLKLSGSGIELQKLLDVPDIGGRIAFEVRSCFPFLIDEWGSRWRLARGSAESLTLLNL